MRLRPPRRQLNQQTAGGAQQQQQSKRSFASSAPILSVAILVGFSIFNNLEQTSHFTASQANIDARTRVARMDAVQPSSEARMTKSAKQAILRHATHEQPKPEATSPPVQQLVVPASSMKIIKVGGPGAVVKVTKGAKSGMGDSDEDGDDEIDEDGGGDENGVADIAVADIAVADIDDADNDAETDEVDSNNMNQIEEPSPNYPASSSSSSSPTPSATAPEVNSIKFTVWLTKALEEEMAQNLFTAQIHAESLLQPLPEQSVTFQFCNKAKAKAQQTAEDDADIPTCPASPTVASRPSDIQTYMTEHPLQVTFNWTFITADANLNASQKMKKQSDLDIQKKHVAAFSYFDPVGNTQRTLNPNALKWTVCHEETCPDLAGCRHQNGKMPSIANGKNDRQQSLLSDWSFSGILNSVYALATATEDAQRTQQSTFVHHYEDGFAPVGHIPNMIYDKAGHVCMPVSEHVRRIIQKGAYHVGQTDETRRRPFSGPCTCTATCFTPQASEANHSWPWKSWELRDRFYPNAPAANSHEMHTFQANKQIKMCGKERDQEGASRHFDCEPMQDRLAMFMARDDSANDDANDGNDAALATASERSAPLGLTCPVHQASSHHMYFVPEHKLIFCGIPKVAITEWVKFIRYSFGARDYLSLPHFKVDREVFQFRHLDMDVARNIWYDPSWTRAVFFRDPAERLLSAYLNKVRGNSKNAKYMLGLAEERQVSFDEFVRILTRDPKTNATAPVPWGVDPHWKPQYMTCGMDVLLPNFDFVGNIDHAAVQTKMLLERVGMWEDYGKTFAYGKTKVTSERSACAMMPPSSEATNDGISHGFNQHHQTSRDVYRHSTNSKQKQEEFYTPELRRMVEQAYATDYAIWNDLKIRNATDVPAGMDLEVVKKDCAARNE